MAKFGKLVANEYIKLKKISTLIIMILAVLLTVAYLGIAKLVDYTMNSEFFYMGSVEESLDWEKSSLQTELEALKAEENPVDETYIAIEQAEQRLRIVSFELEHCVLEYDHWTFLAAENFLSTLYMTEIENSADYSKEIEQFTRAIDNRDWKSYLTMKIDFTRSAGKESGLSEQEIKNMTTVDQYCLDHDIMPVETDDAYMLVKNWDTARQRLETLEASEKNGQLISSDTMKTAKDAFALYDYRIQHEAYYDVSENTGWMNNGKFDFWNVLNGSYMISGIIGVLIIVIAGGIVASEFSQGTIKFLLINPVKRWKILMAKYFTAISFGYLILLISFLVAVVMSAMLMGFDNIDAYYHYISGDEVKRIPGILYTLRTYFFGSIDIVVNATFAFAISSMIRSTALAVGAGIAATFIGNTLVSILGMFQMDWGRFLIFSNTDMQAIVEGNSMFVGHTPGFAAAIVLIHLFVFLLIAWDGFTRREI